MIGLVLDDAGGKFLELEVERRARPDRSRARGCAGCAGLCRGCPGCSRQPSQSSTRSRPIAVTSGLMMAIGTISVAPVRGSSSSIPATKSRRLSCTCGAASPIAVVLVHRLHHVVDELLNRRRLDVLRIDRPCAFARSTGCPSRATFRMDMTDENYTAREREPMSRRVPFLSRAAAVVSSRGA